MDEGKKLGEGDIIVAEANLQSEGKGLDQPKTGLSPMIHGVQNSVLVRQGGCHGKQPMGSCDLRESHGGNSSGGNCAQSTPVMVTGRSTLAVPTTGGHLGNREMGSFDLQESDGGNSSRRERAQATPGKYVSGSAGGKKPGVHRKVH